MAVVNNMKNFQIILSISVFLICLYLFIWRNKDTEQEKRIKDFISDINIMSNDSLFNKYFIYETFPYFEQYKISHFQLFDYMRLNYSSFSKSKIVNCGEYFKICTNTENCFFILFQYDSVQIISMLPLKKGDRIIGWIKMKN
jgi:hypothetical protein